MIFRNTGRTTPGYLKTGNPSVCQPSGLDVFAVTEVPLSEWEVGPEMVEQTALSAARIGLALKFRWSKIAS
jgi:hypothetical protein